MYNQKSKQDSMEIITWTTLGATTFILLILIGRGLINKLLEGTAFGYIGLSFLLLLVLGLCIRIFFEIKSHIKKEKKNNKKRLKLFKLKNGKFFQIGYWRPKMPGTVNTCPEEWNPSLMVKNIDGLRDYPKIEHTKN